MNKQKSISNVATRESGLKMETITEGLGKNPTVGDAVLIHYILYLGSGTSSSEYDYDNECYVDDLVDSTYEDRPFAGPIEIIVGTATPKDTIYNKGDSIEGLNEALLDMKVGCKRRLLIPSKLAYGSEGASSFHTFHGYRTPPDKGLDMIIELVEIRESGSDT